MISIWSLTSPVAFFSSGGDREWSHSSGTEPCRHRNQALKFWAALNFPKHQKIFSTNSQAPLCTLCKQNFTQPTKNSVKKQQYGLQNGIIPQGQIWLNLVSFFWDWMSSCSNIQSHCLIFYFCHLSGLFQSHSNYHSRLPWCNHHCSDHQLTGK